MNLLEVTVILLPILRQDLGYPIFFYRERKGHTLMVEFVLRLQEATEFLSAVLIGIGVLSASYLLVRLLLTARQKTAREMHQAYQTVRLKLSRHLTMALEFQLAADLLGTTVTPSWDQLGRLGTIAAIRTFLNYFLAHEIDEVEKVAQGESR